MKNSAKYAVRLKALCKKLKREAPPSVMSKAKPLDPVSELLLSCLSAVTTENKARIALRKLNSNFVDYNELRVCRVEEIVEVLGKGFPQAREVARQMIGLLKQIFDQLDRLSLDNIKEDGKREAKMFLENLQDATPYIVSRMMLRVAGAHAFPVHQKMYEMLRSEEVVNLASDIDDVHGFLERQISASEVHSIYALLRRHSDNFKPPRASAKKKEKNDSEKNINTSTEKKIE